MNKKYIIGGLFAVVTVALVIGATCFFSKYKHRDYHSSESRISHLFNKVDKDDNGLISRTEYQRINDKISKRFDENEDGMVSFDEIPQHKNRHKKYQKMALWFSLPQSAKDKPVNIDTMLAKTFTAIDGNNDDALSEQEVLTAAKEKAFAALDNNGDGLISKEEFKRR